MTSTNILRAIREPVLKWLETLRIDGSRFRYRFSKTSGDSLFTTCFALFILDLFKETDNLSDREKSAWADYIKRFQREEDGLFYPDPVYHPDKERAIFQATCFCLSALSILGEKPKYRLSVVDSWKTNESVEKYLMDRGCHLGYSGSGNKAMFQAIFLTHAYENTGDERLLEAMEDWFAFHNGHQNRRGFWGRGERGRLYAGLQNAFHQYVIYEYWERAYPRIETVAETVLRLQDREGYFAPTPGGDSCKDYDSIHMVLSHPGIGFQIRNKDRLEKSVLAIMKCRNTDGGFCDKNKYGRIYNIPYVLLYLLRDTPRDIRRVRSEKIMKSILKRKYQNDRRWVKEKQPFQESTLWDTWFRCLTLAELDCALSNNGFDGFRFHTHIGLGYNAITKHQPSARYPVNEGDSEAH